MKGASDDQLRQLLVLINGDEYICTSISFISIFTAARRTTPIIIYEEVTGGRSRVTGGFPGKMGIPSHSAFLSLTSHIHLSTMI